MIEFIQLMGIKRILFLVSLVLYIIVIFIVLCSDSSSQNHTSTETCAGDAYEEDEDENDEDLFPEDASYTTLSDSSEPKSPGVLRKLFRNKSKDDDFWYL